MKTKRTWLAAAFMGLAWLTISLSGVAESPWKVVKEPLSPARTLDIYRLHFVNPDNGWIVGGYYWQHGKGLDSFVGYRTQDGGRTWQEVHVPSLRGVFNTTDEQLIAAYRLTSDDGWIGGSEHIAHTRDGGTTWEVVALRPRITMTPDLQELANRGKLNIFGIHFWNSQDGLLLCHIKLFPGGDIIGSTLLSTEDGGMTWRPIHIWASWLKENGWEMRMLPNGEGWMYNPRLYYTTNQGKSWTPISPIENFPIYDTYFALSHFGMIVHSSPPEGNILNAMYSLDKGVTWFPAAFLGNMNDLTPFIEQTPTHRVSLEALTFGPELRGWAAGWGGIILATEDGVHWTIEESPTDKPLGDLQFIGGIVYAVGDGGIVLRKETEFATRVQPQGKMSTTLGYLKGSIVR